MCNGVLAGLRVFTETFSLPLNLKIILIYIQVKVSRSDKTSSKNPF